MLIAGPTTGAVFAVAEEIRCNEEPADEAPKGTEATFRVPEKIRENDKLYVMRRVEPDEFD